MSSAAKLVPPSLPPELLRSLLWLEKTEGRDKLLRLVVYSTKFVVDSLRLYAANPPVDVIKRMRSGAAMVATSRKLFRMFRSLEFLQSALESVALTDPLERVADSLKNLSLALWLLFDHIQWLNKAQYTRLQPDTIKRIDILHSQSWFSGLLFAALLALYRLRQLVRQEQAIVSAVGLSNATPLTQRQLVALQDKKAKQILAVAKNTTDLIIPAARLGWVSASEQTVGLAGTITSLIGIYQTYPAKV